MRDKKEAALLKGERIWTTVAVAFAVVGFTLRFWGAEDPLQTIAVVCWAWAIVAISWAAEFRGKRRMYQDLARRRGRS